MCVLLTIAPHCQLYLRIFFLWRNYFKPWYVKKYINHVRQILRLTYIFILGLSIWVQTIFVTCVKFTVTIAFYLLSIQVMEVYPTCIRQTGSSVGGIVANIFGILGPYIVYLVRKQNLI